MYCTYLPENKTRCNKFLLQVAREWITVDSKQCSIAPGTSGISKTPAYYNDASFRFDRRLRDHMLETIVTGRKTNLTRACIVCCSKGKLRNCTSNYEIISSDMR